LPERIADPRTARPRLCQVAVALLALWLLVSGLHDVALVLAFLPTIALFGMLLSGRTPGEALLTRLREARRPRRRNTAEPFPGAVRDESRTPRGTLLARKLAGRAPPRPASVV
jgi:hypothetical protein